MYIKWKRETTSGATSDEWQRMTTNDNEWQQMSGTTHLNKWESVKQSDLKFQNETKGQPSSWRILFNFLCNI